MTDDSQEAALLEMVAVRVRDRRLALGLSQREVARRAGLHWTFVGTFERGKRNITMVNLARLARALEYEDVGELMQGLGL